MYFTSLLLAGGLFAPLAWSKTAACKSKSFSHPEVFGTKIVSIEAKEVKGHVEANPLVFLGMHSIRQYYNVPWPTQQPIDFCNVTVTYTHPGSDDTIHVYVWLPLEEWNGNFLAMGGLGWAAGSEGSLTPAVANGYAGANTDAGHSFHVSDVYINARDWALKAPGHVDWNALQNFASTAVDDLTHIAKDIVKSFYGTAPKYSYWNGCSTGGRQGLMQAQRFPKNYNGILAAAPANNWVTFLVTEFWGQLQMRKADYYPPPCELAAIQEAAIEACDELDGVKDGVVAAVSHCKFDAKSAVGRSCCDGTKKVSKAAAKLVNLMYEGPKNKNGKAEWYGYTHEMPFAAPTHMNPFGGLLQTACDPDHSNCRPSPFPISWQWIKLFLAKDPHYDPLSMTEDEFFDFLHSSRQKYDSIMSASDPDLSAFRAAGGKLITWHGLADQLIFPNGTADYYERVLALDPEARDFYRFFEAPGIEHCVGGPGALPAGIFGSLVQWVEEGKAPDSVDAATIPVDPSETVKQRILCPYPQVASYVGGDPNERSSFKCTHGFGTEKATFTSHNEL